MTAQKKNPKKGPARARFWVGLGASAGGLEALRGLVRTLPQDSGATFIVAQHMAPHHRSMLSEIIGRESSLPVLDVTDKLLPKPNTIYITPPNHNIVVEKNRLRLIDPSREPAAPKPSVDRFFRSLAEAKEKQAIGIILSGTGSDGAQGMQAIRTHGGITIAQDELTAKYTSMPTASIESGCVDLVMSPEEIGGQFQKIVSLPRDLNLLHASPIDMDNVSELIQLLLKHTRVNFRHYKTATFQRRVERRMAALNVSSLDDYVSIASSSSREVRALFQDLLISVTSFFRDASEFEALKSHIATIVQTKKDEFIRIWIAGTATGEEAYSIAILFAEAMGGAKAFSSSKIQIFATDIDENAIEVARRGFYPETALDEVSEAHVSEYFDVAPAGYTVKKAIREKIVFSLHNVAQDPPFLNIDLISCRNLLIYFQPTLQSQVFARFHYALIPHGVMFLGKSEAIGTSESLFRIASPEKHIFFQRPSLERRPIPDPLFDRPREAQRRPQVAYPPPEARELVLSNARFDALVSVIGPNGLMVTSDMQIRKAYGDVNQYVGLAAGAVSTNAMSLIRDPFRQDVRIGVPNALRNKTRVRGITHVNQDDPDKRERVDVYPIEAGEGDEAVALIIFKSWEEAPVKDGNPDPISQNWRQQIDSLNQELAVARSNLQQTIEELETSNEELQALNEELQSSNEELQSTNEELETSNEELQSTNEELSTVNEELHVNSQQLTMVNQSLRSILDNVSIPLLVVDRGLNITNMSLAAETIFGISPDIELPHASRCHLPSGFPNLIKALNSAMASGERVDINIDEGDSSAIMTVAPHFSSTDELVGAIVIVSDNTHQLRKTRNELQLVIDNIPIGLMVRDGEGTIIKTNPVGETLLSGTASDLIGSCYYDYLEDDVAREIRAEDRRILESGEPVIGELKFVTTKVGDSHWLRVSRIPAEHPDFNTPVIYSVKQDVTEQQTAEDALKLSQNRLDQAVRASKIGLWEWDIETHDLYWSDRFKEIVGVNNETFGGKLEDFVGRLHPDDSEATVSAVNDHVEKQTPYDVTYRLRHQNGDYRWIKAYGFATRDSQGKARTFIGTVEDVTESRSNLESLKERNQQLSLASKLSGFGYWKIDLVDNSVFWSDQIYVIHGVTPETYTPELETTIEFYHPDDVQRVQDFVAHAIEQGEPFEFEARLVRPDKTIRHVRSNCTPDLSADGKVAAIFGIFVDMTEDKAKENQLRETLTELSRSNEELNRFSYVCSHDMKEPVRMIESMSALLLNADYQINDDKRSDLLERINKNTIRLRAIIDSLLAYSRIDASIEQGSVDLADVLSDIQDAFSLIVTERNAVIKIGKLPVIEGSKTHFSQLFQNLIGNALKFSDKERPEIVVSASKRKGSQIFVVEDNGPGIPEGSRASIFEVFNRLHRRDDIEGTGLGLSIAQRIVHQYGGAIRCLDSKLGGAKFEITMPLSSEKSRSAK